MVSSVLYYSTSFSVSDLISLLVEYVNIKRQSRVKS